MRRELRNGDMIGAKEKYIAREGMYERDRKEIINRIFSLRLYC